MPFADFHSKSSAVAERVFASYPDGALDEQAGPAYLRGLGLSRWLFWRRLREVQSLLPEQGETAIDFGTGFGMMLPLLAQRFERVWAIDLMPDLSRRYLELWRCEEQTELPHVAWGESIEEAGDAPIDLILALDVLEHVDDLDALVASFAERLSPQGRLIVSGPTENFWYRLGRRIVGFSGDYHVRTIFDIRASLERCFEIEQTRSVGLGFTLFEIYVAAPKKSSKTREATTHSEAEAPR